MTVKPKDLVFIGLSLSSSWGNGHATTYRALLRGLADIGQTVLFLERDVPWYAGNRDLPVPDFCEIGFYYSPEDLCLRFGQHISDAEAVIVGSYVLDGIQIIDYVLGCATGIVGFYDIDTPVTLEALDSGEQTYLARRQIAEFDLYFSFTGGPTLDRLSRDFGVRYPVALYCAVDDRSRPPVKVPLRWDLGYLGTYSRDRQPTLERLLLDPARCLPRHRFVVAGPQYPSEIDWPDNVERIDHIAPVDHPAFYAAQRFTLNVTRAAMVAAGWSPSVRLFEAASCATPIISDRWPGLSSLLQEKQAILIADDTNQIVQWLTHMPSSDRHQIGLRAQDVVLTKHTGTARAQQMLRAIAVIRGSNYLTGC